MSDFTWRMTVIDLGRTIEETAAKLPEVSETARERYKREITVIYSSRCRTRPPLWSEMT